MRQLRFGKHNHNYTHPNKPRYASLDRVVHRPKTNDRLRVVTYNIQLSRKIAKATELLSGHEHLHDADIICLQEMDPTGVKLIANTLDYNYIYYPAILHPRSAKDFGNAILSKWPIKSDQKIILPKVGTGRLQRIAVYATVTVGHVKIAVVCLHMKIYAKRNERRIPIDHIIESIDPTIKHCIIAGDFNTFTKASRKTIAQPFSEAQFDHVTDSVGSTYKYWYLLNKKASLDHIFIKGFNVLGAGKVANRKPSDHIPVWGDLKFKG